MSRIIRSSLVSIMSWTEDTFLWYLLERCVYIYVTYVLKLPIFKFARYCCCINYLLIVRSHVTRAWNGLSKEENTTWMWSVFPVNYTNPSLTDDHPPHGIVWAGLVTAGPIGRWEHDDINKEHRSICQKTKCEVMVICNSFRY